MHRRGALLFICLLALAASKETASLGVVFPVGLALQRWGAVGSARGDPRERELQLAGRALSDLLTLLGEGRRVSSGLRDSGHLGPLLPIAAL